MLKLVNILFVWQEQHKPNFNCGLCFIAVTVRMVDAVGVVSIDGSVIMTLKSLLY